MHAASCADLLRLIPDASAMLHESATAMADVPATVAMAQHHRRRRRHQHHPVAVFPNAPKPDLPAGGAYLLDFAAPNRRR